MGIQAMSDIVDPFERQLAASLVSLSRIFNNQKETRKPVCFLVVDSLCDVLAIMSDLVFLDFGLKLLVQFLAFR